MGMPKYLYANRTQFLYTLLFQSAFFASGVVIVLFINRFFNDDKSYAYIGTLLSLGCILAGGLMQINGANFSLTILMGYTRRYFLLWSPLQSALLTLQGWLTSFFMYKLEKLLYHVLYSDYSCELPLELAFQWQIAALSAVAISFLCLFFGALNIKFGSKGFLTIWFAVCFGSTPLLKAVNLFQSGSSIPLAKLGGAILTLAGLLTPAMWAGMGAALLLAALGFSVWVYLQAEIRL